jgi:RNA polymerase sigma factor (sigma-70 family)
MSGSDLELLAQYARQHAEDAFAEIVHRHLDLVFSAALRQVRSPQLAEEVAQSVFTDLARQAHRLAADIVLTAWLYQVTRRTAIDVVRREARRQVREQAACELNAMNAAASDWTHIEPLLDDTMQALEDSDRTSVLLRYFENKSLREVGETLGTNEDAARKRVRAGLSSPSLPTPCKPRPSAWSSRSPPPPPSSEPASPQP